MWELDHKEDWAPKNWCFQIVVLKTLESSLDCKEIKPVNPKGNKSWIFTRRTDTEAEALILWPLDAKSRLIGKDPDVGKDWRQKKRGQRMRQLDSITNWLDMNLSKLQEIVEDRGTWCAAAHQVTESQTWLSGLTVIPHLWGSSSLGRGLPWSSKSVSHSVMSNSLWPHGPQHCKLSRPSLSPGVCSDSCPLSWWCHPTISSSAALFSFCPAPSVSQHQGLFQWVRSLHQVGEVLELQLQHHSFQWISRVDFL